MNEIENFNDQGIYSYIRDLNKKAEENRDFYKKQLRHSIWLLALGVCAVLSLPYAVACLDNWIIPSTEINNIKLNISENKSDVSNLRKSVSPLSISRIDIAGYEVGWIKKSKRDSLIVELNGKGIVELTFDELGQSGSVEIKEQQFIFEASEGNVHIRSDSYSAGAVMEMLVFADDTVDNNVFSRRVGEQYWYRQEVDVSRDKYFGSVDVAFSKDHVFLFHSGGYIYRSSDLGKSWRLIGSGIKFRDFLVDDNCRIAILLFDGNIKYSSDCGENWIVVDSGIDEQEYYVSGLIAPSGKAILICSDGYLSELNMTTGSLNYGISTGFDYNDYRGIFFSPKNIGVLIHGDSYPIVSVDGGQSWKAVKLDEKARKSIFLRSVEFYDDGSAFAFDSQGEISLVSNDSGRSWGFATGIPSIKRVVSSVSADDYRVIFGKDSDAIIKRHQSTGWEKIQIYLDDFSPKDPVFSGGKKGYLVSDNKLYEFELYSDKFMNNLSDSDIVKFAQSSNTSQSHIPIRNLLVSQKSLEESLSLRTRVEQVDNKKYIEKIVLRSLIVTIFAYFIGVLINNARYAMKLSVFYDSVASSVRLAQSLSDDPVSVQDLVKIINVCMPSIEYGKQLKLSAQEMLRINQMRFG
ncbi:WD40/YVTN/BNR-like repeat-containing protein [Teredinibacter turnerae]|uniref:WD40/YVTN/BNR-like repeat-containing protein n=1 Tax=Teredinibacter turnerae TaxID=2426 RepID=UPI00037D0D30|nr:PQQ-binding-like beta-propeller repeat protein [Teredinibacter turnerae]